MVNLVMPAGMADGERIAWLHRTGEAPVLAIGMPEGVTENQESTTGNPLWGMWWTNND